MEKEMPEGIEWPRFENLEPVRIGDWFTDKVGKSSAVKSLLFVDGSVAVEAKGGWVTYYSYGERVKRPPVLAADGMPLEVGQTVYLLPGEWCGEFPLRCYSAGDEMVVEDLRPNHEVEGVLRCVGDGKCDCFPLPCQLTHTKPEPDTWERIEHDAKVIDETIESEWGGDPTDARDLVRRCRALAERERGE